MWIIGQFHRAQSRSTKLHHNSQGSNQGGRGRGCGCGCGNQSRGDYNNNSQNQGGHGNNSSGQGGRGSCPTCHICGKNNHTAAKCYHRFDHLYQVDEGHFAQVVVMTSSYQVDPNWYIDTSATDHITSDLDRLTVREKYHGGDQVQVSNGAGLHISHVGHCSINTIANSLALKDVLCVPNI